MPTSRVETMRAQVRQAITNAILRRRRAPWEPAAGRWIRTAPGLENLRPHFQFYLNLASTTRIKILAVDDAEPDVLAYLAFPPEHWRQIWSNNPLERLNKEIKRRTNVVGVFPNPAALLRLAGHVLIEQHDEWDCADRRYFSENSMKLLTAASVELEEVSIAAIDAA